MARAVQLSTLITRVRQRSNFEGDDDFISDVEITDHLNESLSELYDYIRGQYGQGYYRASQPFTTDPGVDSYSLPENFLSLISVDVAIGPNMIRTAQPYMESERNLFRAYPTAWSFSGVEFYRLTASNISFIPPPNGNYVITVNYVPTATILTSPSDTFDGVAGWEEAAVLDSAIKCLLKDGQLDVIQQLEARKQGILERIKTLAGQRDAGMPERVQDTKGYTDPWSDLF